MVLGVATLAEGLATGACERQRRGIQKHHGELTEQVAPSRKQPLFDQIFDRAWRDTCGSSLLIRVELLPQPGHCAIQVV